MSSVWRQPLTSDPSPASVPAPTPGRRATPQGARKRRARADWRAPAMKPSPTISRPKGALHQIWHVAAAGIPATGWQRLIAL